MSTEKLADGLPKKESELMLHNVLKTRRITRYFKEEETGNRRYHVIQDIPSEALFDQEHQITLSPSPSQIREMLSSEDYPLGIVGKRKYFHGHGAILVNRLKTLNALGLSDKDIQRLERIFWEAKNGIPWSLELEDEKFSYMKMKAMEKKKKKAGLLGPAGAGRPGFEKSRRKSSGYDAEALAKAAGRKRRKAMSPTLEDETTQRASQDTQEAVLSTSSSMDLQILVTREKSFTSQPEEDMIINTANLDDKELDSTEYKPKERKRQKEFERRLYHPREEPKMKYSVLEKISSEKSTDEPGSSKKSSISDKTGSRSKRSTASKPPSEEDKYSVTSDGRTPSVFTDGSVDEEDDESEERIAVSRSRRLEMGRETDTSAKEKVARPRKKSSSSKKRSAGSQGSETQLSAREDGLSRKGSKTGSGSSRKRSKSDKKSRSKERKSKISKDAETEELRFSDVPDRPSFTDAAEMESKEKSHGIGSPSGYGDRPGLRMLTVARKLHNLWKFSQKTRSAESLRGADHVTGPAAEPVDKHKEAPASKRFSGRWDDVNQESSSVIKDFIQTQMKPKSLTPSTTEDKSAARVPKYPPRDIYSVFKELSSKKAQAEPKAQEPISTQKVSFKDMVRRIMKVSSRTVTDDAVDDVVALSRAEVLGKEDGQLVSSLLEEASSKLLVLEAHETKQGRPARDAAELIETDLERDPGLASKRKQDDSAETRAQERERLLRYYDENQLQRRKSSSTDISRGRKKLDNLEEFRKRQERLTEGSLKETDEVDDETPYVSPEIGKGVGIKVVKQSSQKLYLKRKKGSKAGSPAVSRQRSHENKYDSPTFTLKRKSKESRPRKINEDADESKKNSLPNGKISKAVAPSISRSESEESSEESSAASDQSSEEEWDEAQTPRQRRKEARVKSPAMSHKRKRHSAKLRSPPVARPASGESSEDLSSISSESIVEAGEVSPTSRPRWKEAKKKTPAGRSKDVREISPSMLRKKRKEASEKRPSISRERRKKTRDRSPSRQSSKEAKEKSPPTSLQGGKEEREDIPPMSRQISQEAREITAHSRHRKKETRERSPSVSRQPSKEVGGEINLISGQRGAEVKQKSSSISRQRRKKSKEKTQSSEDLVEESPSSSDETSLEEKKKSPSAYRERRKEVKEITPSISGRRSEEDQKESPLIYSKRHKEKSKRSPPISHERSNEDQEGRPSILRKRSKDRRKRRPPISRERSKEDQEAHATMAHKRSEDMRQRSPPISRERKKEDQEEGTTILRKRSKDRRKRSPPIFSKRSEEDQEGSPSVSRKRSKDRKKRSPPISHTRSKEDREESPSVSRKRSKDKRKRSPPISGKRSEEDQEGSPSVSRKRSKDRRKRSPPISGKRSEEGQEESPSVSRKRSKDRRKRSPQISRERSEEDQEGSPSVSRKRSKDRRKRSPPISREISEEDWEGSPSVSRKRSKDRRKRSPPISSKRNEEDKEGSPSVSRKQSKDRRKRSPPISSKRSEEDQEGSPSVSRKQSKDRRKRSPPISSKRSEEDQEGSPSVSRKRSKDRTKRSPPISSERSEEDWEGSPSVSRKRSKDRRKRSPPISSKRSEEDKEGSPSVSRKRSKDRRKRSPPISSKRSEEDQEGSPSVSRKRSKDRTKRSPPISRESSEEDWEGSLSVSRKRSKDRRKRSPPTSRERIEEDKEGRPSISRKRSTDVRERGPLTSRKRSKDLRRSYEEEQGPKRDGKKRSSSRVDAEDYSPDDSQVSSERNLTRKKSKSKDKTPTSKGVSGEDLVGETGRRRRERRKRDDDDMTEGAGQTSDAKIRRDKTRTSPEQRLSKLGLERREKRGSQMSSIAASTSREGRFPSIFSDISAKTRARYSDVTLPNIDSKYSYTDDDLSSVEVFSTDHSSSSSSSTSKTRSHDSETTSSSSDSDGHRLKQLHLPHIGSTNLLTAKNRKKARALFLSQLSKPAPPEPIKPPPRITLERPFSGWDVVGQKASSTKPALNVRLPTLDDTLPAMLKLARTTQNSYNIPIMDLDGCNYPPASPRTEAKLYIAKFGITELLEFLLQSLIINRPDKPIDYLVGLTRTILQEMATYYRMSDAFTASSETSSDFQHKK